MRFELDVREFDAREVIEIQTSTGDMGSYLRWEEIVFEVEGQPVELTIYKEPHGGEVFLLFANATSGIETYESGRYLEPHDLCDGKMLVDFNCAYDE